MSNGNTKSPDTAGARRVSDGKRTFLKPGAATFPFAAGAVYNLRFDYKSSDGNLNTATATIGSSRFGFPRAAD